MRRDKFIAAAIVSAALAVISFGIERRNHERDVVVQRDTVYVTDTIYSDDVITHSLNIAAIAAFEGCDTNVYWPHTDKSGPTIGYGLDLGNIGKSRIDTLLHGLVSQRTIDRLKSAHGKTGRKAQRWVAENRGLRITKRVADSILTRTCFMYWKQARREFPGIERMDNTTQSVVLSLAINYGTGAKALAALRDPIRRNDIGAVVAHLRRLEAGTKCKGLIRRRREERTMLELAVAGNTHQNGGAQVVFD